MNRKKSTVISKLRERFRKMNVGRGLYMAFIMPTMLSLISTRAFAADTIWTKASAIMQDVYTQILGISNTYFGMRHCFLHTIFQKKGGLREKTLKFFSAIQTIEIERGT